MLSWYEFKLFVSHSSAVSMDALHVLVGVGLLLLVALVSGSPIGRWSNCVPVLALELANEWLDLHVEIWPSPGMQYGEGANDILLTMLLPVVLTLAVRYRPGLFGQSDGAAAEAVAPAAATPPPALGDEIDEAVTSRL